MMTRNIVRPARRALHERQMLLLITTLVNESSKGGLVDDHAFLVVRRRQLDGSLRIRQILRILEPRQVRVNTRHLRLLESSLGVGAQATLTRQLLQAAHARRIGGSNAADVQQGDTRAARGS